MRDVIEIETERLKLRPLRMSDAARVARFAGDPGVARMVARVPEPYFEIAAEAWIMTLNARAPRGDEYVFAVELEGEGLVGAIGAHQVSGVRNQVSDGASDTRHLTPDTCFEVGYWFGRPFWGQGFATEALRGFLSEARKLGALQAGHFVDNPASGRVLEKGGFAYTGETTELFSMARGARAKTRRMRYAAPSERGFGVREAVAC
jgi:RimJ/RimL family protein N-acetyltransferase